MIEREVSQQQNIVVIITKEYAKKKKITISLKGFKG